MGLLAALRAPVINTQNGALRACDPPRPLQPHSVKIICPGFKLRCDHLVKYPRTKWFPRDSNFTPHLPDWVQLLIIFTIHYTCRTADSELMAPGCNHRSFPIYLLPFTCLTLPHPSSKVVSNSVCSKITENFLVLILFLN